MQKQRTNQLSDHNILTVHSNFPSVGWTPLTQTCPRRIWSLSSCSRCVMYFNKVVCQRSAITYRTSDETNTRRHEGPFLLVSHVNQKSKFCNLTFPEPGAPKTKYTFPLSNRKFISFRITFCCGSPAPTHFPVLQKYVHRCNAVNKQPALTTVWIPLSCNELGRFLVFTASLLSGRGASSSDGASPSWFWPRLARIDGMT